MLRITQSQSAAGAKKYFDDALARPDYYLKDAERTASAWGGKGAARLGLSGDVTREQFHALCDNRNPVSGERLTPRTKAGRTVGYDFTFSAKKSVSILAQHDARIVTAFQNAVKETMEEIEQAAAARVRINGRKDENRTTGNLLWAAFTHHTTRPLPDGLPDMHLHQHVYALNATFDEMENRWKAGQFAGLKKDAPYYEAAFDARLSAKLVELGYAVERQATGWEIAGISETLRAKFSRRTAEIEARAKEHGITDAKEKDTLGAKTRQRKSDALTVAELRERWFARLSPDERRAIANADKQPRQQKTMRAAQALAFALSHHLERASVCDEKTLLRDALRVGVGAVLPETVRDAFADAVKKGDILTISKNNVTFLTTAHVLAEERAALAFARAGRGACVPLARGVRKVADLSREQRAAVNHMLTAKDRVIAVRGAAGVGKTTLMRETVAQLEAAGHRVFAFAPTADAARGVLRAEGFTDADTLARLFVDETLQASVSGGVLWADEAGLMSAGDMHRLFQIAKKHGCRILLTGDTSQHASVERGDALRLLETYGGVRRVEVSTIRRQVQEAYRRAVSAFSRGDAGDGLNRLERLGWVRETPDAGERYARLARDVVESVEVGKTVLVIAPTHAEGERVTEALRAKLKSRGQLRGQERAVAQLRPLHLTDAQKRDAAHYAPGRVVQFEQNAPGFTRGERVTVHSVDRGNVRVSKPSGEITTLPLAHAARFGVYAAATLPLHPGDTLRLTKNGMAHDAKGKTVRLNNGQALKVEGLTEKGDIRFTNGVILPKNFGHIAYGYVSTSHAAQGKTVDRVFIAQSAASGRAATREQLYVSASRARESLRIYTDARPALYDAAGRSGARLSAHELLRLAPGQSPLRQKTPQNAFRRVLTLPLQRSLLHAQKAAQIASYGVLRAYERMRRGVASRQTEMER